MQMRVFSIQTPRFGEYNSKSREKTPVEKHGKEAVEKVKEENKNRKNVAARIMEFL